MSLWDSQAGTLAEARRAVWAEDDYEAGVEHCLAQLAPLVPVLERCGRVVDIGCGIGRILVPLAQLHPGADLIGLDSSPAMLAHARETSERCRRTVRLQRGGVEVLDYLAPLSGFYSVVTFQHLPVDEQAAYIAAAGRAMRSGGVGRFQLVTVADPGPLSHPVTVDEASRWCADAGLVVEAVDADPLFDCWAWLTVTKP